MNLHRYEVTGSTPDGQRKHVIRAGDDISAADRWLRGHPGGEVVSVSRLDDSDGVAADNSIQIGGRSWPSRADLAREIGCTSSYVGSLLRAGRVKALAAMVVAAEARRKRGAA